MISHERFDNKTDKILTKIDSLTKILTQKDPSTKTLMKIEDTSSKILTILDEKSEDSELINSDKVMSFVAEMLDKKTSKSTPCEPILEKKQSNDISEKANSSSKLELEQILSQFSEKAVDVKIDKIENPDEIEQLVAEVFSEKDAISEDKQSDIVDSRPISPVKYLAYDMKRA